MLALIERNGAGLPRTLSPHAAGRASRSKRRSRGRAATSSASARTITSMPTNSPGAASIPAPRAGAVPKHPIVFSKVPEIRGGASQPTCSIDQRVSDGDRLRSRACGDHRQRRARDCQGGRVRPRLGLHDHQRCDRARPAGPLQPMADRQVAGHVLPDGALGGDAGTRSMSTGRHPLLRQRGAAAEVEDRAADLRHSNDHRHPVAGYHPAARRHHRHRHAGRRRHRLRSAADISKPGDVVRIEIDGIGALENRFAEQRQ